MVKRAGRKIYHERRITKTGPGAIIYTEQRGLRALRFETGEQGKPEKSNLLNSENPSDKARFLNLAANRLLTKAGEKTLQKVIEDVIANKANDMDAATDTASVRWLASLMKKYGALSPIAVAAQFSFHQRSIIEKLSWYADGAESNVISDEVADKSINEIVHLFSAVYALCDAWHWWRMELHGDHARLIDAQVIAASRKRGATTNRDKKEQRESIIAEVFNGYVLSGGRLDILASDIAQKIKQEAKGRCAKNEPNSIRFISDDQLTRIVRDLVKRRRK